MPEPLAVTVPDVAQALRLPESTIRAMTRDGRLPRVPGLGRTVRIPWGAVATADTPSAALRALAAKLREVGR